MNNRLLIYQFKIRKLINRLEKLALIIISKCFSNYKIFFKNVKVVRIEIGKENFTYLVDNRTHYTISQSTV